MSRSLPSLSIIITTYNRINTLSRSIESALSQLDLHDQLIIVNDGSSDATRAYLKKLKSRSKKIKIITHSNNRGVQHARNSGIKAAAKDWICFLDSDDYYLPHALITIKKYLSQVPKDISVVQFMLKSTKKRNGSYHLGYLPLHSWYQYQPTIEDIVIKSNFVGDMHRCIRSTIAKKHLWLPSNPGFETYHYAKMLAQGVNFLYINKIVVKVDESDTQSHSKTRLHCYPAEHIIIFKTLLHEFAAIFNQRPHQKSIYQFFISKCYLNQAKYLHAFIWYLKGVIGLIVSQLVT